MNEQEFIEQEDYELNGYDESAIETDYYDLDGEESVDEVFEDDDFDFIEEESEMDESRRPRNYRPRSRRNARNRARRNALRRKALMGSRPSGYNFNKFIERPKKKKKYYNRPTPSRPANTKNVVKAFAKASQDVENTKAAIRKVDVDNKIQEQKLKKTFSAQSKRISGNEYALAATTVVTKLGDEFPELMENPIVRTLLSAAPTFLQKPVKKEFYKDPRILTTGLTALIALAKELREKGKEPEVVQNVTISPPVKTMDKDQEFTFTATARDAQGNKVDGKTFKWYADDDSKVSIDKEGAITCKMIGKVEIYAEETSTGKSASTQLKIVKAASS